MTAKNKLRGNLLERQVVAAFSSKGIAAKRAWGSNGEAIGHHAEVDVLVSYNLSTKPASINTEIKVQCKKKKKLPDWMGFSEHVDAVVVSENHGKRYIMIELDDFIERFL